jgi:hypothetical protein
MRIKKSLLKHIIKEELEVALFLKEIRSMGFLLEAPTSARFAAIRHKFPSQQMWPLTRRNPGILSKTPG